MADDAVNRGLTAEQVNPFLNVDTLKYLGDEVSQQLYESTCILPPFLLATSMSWSLSWWLSCLLLSSDRDDD